MAWNDGMDVVVFVCNVRIQNLNRSIVCRPLTLNILDTDSVLFVLYFFFISVCCCILRLFFSLSTATNIYLLGSILRITPLDRLPPLSFVVLFLRTHSKCTIILTKKTIFFLLFDIHINVSWAIPIHRLYFTAIICAPNA